MLQIPNDVFLAAILVCLVICLVWENRTKVKTIHDKKVRRSSVTNKSLLLSPIHSGSVARNIVYMDIMSLSSYMPLNISKRIRKTVNENNESVKNNILRKTASDFSIKYNNVTTEKDSPSNEQPVAISIVKRQQTLQVSDLAAKIIFPYMPGCEPDCAGAIELHEKFPQLSRTDIVRFLVARKGSVKLAEEMIEKCLAWHSSYFPLKRKEVEVAMKTNCFVPFGQSKDGSPVVYMRGGLYDNTKATPEQYVLAAAHTIEYSLEQCPDQVNVTVIVHTANVPGHPAATADMDFIKLFIKVRGLLASVVKIVL